MANFRFGLGLAAGTMLAAGAAFAQQPAPVKITVLTAPSMINAYKYHHEPFFKTHLPQVSGGRVTADLRAHDQAGLQLREVTRMNSNGVVDFAYGSYNYLAGDDPQLEGIDLPGVGLSVEEYRKAAESYFPVVQKVLREKQKIEPLFTNSITMQVVFCKGRTNSLADFKGRKVRVFSPAQADYFQAIGAVGVNIAFEEVLPALQQGTVDCAITSTTNGNTARWWEVVTDLYVIPMGWGANFFGANLAFWNKLDDGTRDFFRKEFNGLSDRLWQQAASDLQDGINCNTGQGECKAGVTVPENRRLKVSYPTADDKALHAKTMSDAVLKKWAQRCGRACTETWNGTMGKATSLTAPLS